MCGGSLYPCVEVVCTRCGGGLLLCVEVACIMYVDMVCICGCTWRWFVPVCGGDLYLCVEVICTCGLRDICVWSWFVCGGGLY